MTGAFLADIQTGQAEGKDMDLAEQIFESFTVQSRDMEAVANQFKVGPKIVLRAVMEFLGPGIGGGNAAKGRADTAVAIARKFPATAR